MNKNLILINLKEAKEQLETTISDLESDSDFSEEGFQVELKHAYHHLNFTWNIRNIPIEKYRNMTDKNFNKWSKFPKNKDDYEFETRI
jgi:hypothetical protein